MGQYVGLAKLGSKFEVEWNYSLNTKKLPSMSSQLIITKEVKLMKPSDWAPGMVASYQGS